MTIGKDIAPLPTINPHAYVTSSSGERFTPPYIVEAARKVLCQIDLDPASCKKANEVVKADRIYTREDDALDLPWDGTIFLNPPGSCRNEDGELVDCGNVKTCSCKLVHRFWEKLLNCGPERVPAAIWIGFHLDQLQSLQTPLCFPTCFPRKRVRYHDSEGNEMPSPPHGSYITLVSARISGGYVDRFIENFAPFGQIVVPYRKGE